MAAQIAADPNGGEAVSRRALLASLGCVAVEQTLKSGLARAADSPGSQVADRTSSIRLSAMQATICRDRVYVKLETNHGISGWGEVKGVVPTVAHALVKSLFELLDGQNPTRIEHLWQSMYRAERN